MKKVFIFISAGISFFSIRAQTLKECETLFLKNNLLLLAGRYEIEAAQALKIQAGIWQLPVAELELNAYNPADNRYFDVGAGGQKTLAVQQLIYLGGKKRKEVQWAGAQAEMAWLEFEELIRNLRYELRVAYVKLYFTNRKIELVNRQASRLDTLIGFYSVQAIKNNVSYKDLYRLRSLQLRVNENLRELRLEEQKNQKQLNLICGTNQSIRTSFDLKSFMQSLSSSGIQNADTLYARALVNSPVIRLSRMNMTSDSLYLVWQESLNVPDISIGMAYDQRGGAFNDQIGLRLQLPLRLWSLNRGNAAMAVARLKVSKTQYAYDCEELKQEIQVRQEAYKNTFEIFVKQGQMNMEIYEDVFNGIVNNFTKGNLGLIEFIDFMESYCDTVNQMNENALNMFVAGEEINKTISQIIYNP